LQVNKLQTGQAAGSANGEKKKRAASGVAVAPAVNSVTVPTGTDSVDVAAFQTSIDSLVSEINTIRTTLNASTAALRRSGITI